MADVPSLTTLEKLRPAGRALLTFPEAGWGVDSAGWAAEAVARESTSISSA